MSGWELGLQTAGVVFQVVGLVAGNWLAQPDGQLGHELIAAGLLILAGVTDRGEVGRWTRVGYERGRSIGWRLPRPKEGRAPDFEDDLSSGATTHLGL